MKVAIYARYSTELQDRTSIAGQVANCEALAGREGLDVVARFHDEARSRYDDRRPGYQTMLEALKRGEFAGIVCDETSRATGNQAELHRLAAELRFRDQFLITCDGIDTREESSELVLAVKAAVDAMEGKKIGYRTYRSLRERHREGHCAGGRVYGYSIAPDGDYKRRVVDVEQAAVVLEIFTRYANGESAKTIARSLNERRVPSPGAVWQMKKRRAAGWPHTTILGSFTKASGILRNPIYIGRAMWNKRRGKKVPGTHQRIQKRRPDAEWIEHRDEALRVVSDELWHRVQARLQRTRSNAHAANLRGRPARHLLSGLLVCNGCGAHYVVRNGRAYTCSSLSNGRDSFCTQRTYLPRAEVESQLLAGIKAQLSNPKVVKDRTRRIQAASQAPATNHQAELAALERQIADLADTIVAVGKSDGLTAKLRELEKQKRALAHQPPPVAVLMAGAADQWRDLVANLDQIGKYAQPDELELARTIVHDYIGEVSVVEDVAGVYGLVRMSNGAGYKAGAQDALPDLYLERIPLRLK